MENKIVNVEIPVTVAIETEELNEVILDAIYEYLYTKALPEGIHRGIISPEMEKFLYKKVKEILIKMWAD